MLIIATTKEENELVQKLAKEHMAMARKREDAFAVTMWSIEDVKNNRDISDKNAESFLEDYENRLKEHSISGGWGFLEYADFSDYIDESDEEYGDE